ncbi:MAG: 50S ribosomal protein L10, partial [Clostridia bacterium]|nr:50S ribosomal protein L10 [Clostridia bacterium]
MASEKVLQEKQAFVTALTEKLNGATTGVIVSYSGITVAEDTKLRRDLREAGVEYTVVKNTLLKRAAEAANLNGLDD